MALRCYFLLWLGLGGIIKRRGWSRYKTWISDTVVATANLDGIFGSGDGKEIVEGILIK
jgi:hypothetical protein